jgi:hypothetical protein
MEFANASMMRRQVLSAWANGLAVASILASPSRGEDTAALSMTYRHGSFLGSEGHEFVGPGGSDLKMG